MKRGWMGGYYCIKLKYSEIFDAKNKKGLVCFFPFYQTILFYCFCDIFCLHGLPSGVLREGYGFFRYFSAFCLYKLRQLFSSVFAYSLCSCVPNYLGYRCFWYFSHFYHYNKVMGSYIKAFIYFSFLKIIKYDEQLCSVFILQTTPL
jgi:hypothetical protein